VRRLAAERRRELAAAKRLPRPRGRSADTEAEAFDRALAQPDGGKGNGLARRKRSNAELVRLIERAERDWLAAEEAIEQHLACGVFEGRE